MLTKQQVAARIRAHRKQVRTVAAILAEVDGWLAKDVQVSGLASRRFFLAEQLSQLTDPRVEATIRGTYVAPVFQDLATQLSAEYDTYMAGVAPCISEEGKAAQLASVCAALAAEIKANVAAKTELPLVRVSFEYVDGSGSYKDVSPTEAQRLLDCSPSDTRVRFNEQVVQWGFIGSDDTQGPDAPNRNLITRYGITQFVPAEPGLRHALIKLPLNARSALLLVGPFDAPVDATDEQLVAACDKFSADVEQFGGHPVTADRVTFADERGGQ